MKNILENELFEAFATASENVYVYICDMDTKVFRWSKNAVEYFGLEGEYVEDAPKKWESCVHPNDREYFKRDIEGVFSGEKASHECQYRAQNKYGDYVWLECRGSIVKDRKGKPKIFAGMMTRLDNQNKYDPLTNLRTIHELRKYNFKEGMGAILLVGIDDFRKIVNNYGYNFGDSVLAEFADKLVELCRDGEELFRFQGDEFVIILPQKEGEEGKAFFEEIVKTAVTLGQSCGHVVSPSVSGGIVVFPQDGMGREELIRNLEHSLEHAKSHRKGDVVVFSKNIAERHNRDILLREELSRCIKNEFQGFQLYYQPLVDAKSHRVICCEALLRWKSSNITDSSPTEFIPILEASGEIIKVGLWVLDEALKKAKEWKERYHDITVSVNVSSQQLRDDLFVKHLLQKKDELGINPNSIVIELTESCNVEEPEYLAAQFTKLREHGFRIALDDFGIAYSSLGLLRTLPADSVKIDHSFVRELAREKNEIDLAIIESVVSLCQRLNMHTVIEGIENSQIEEIVSSFKVSLYQGYHYSKPITEAEFEKMLEERQ